jgi:uncharacterized damage-inducible protein DinB
MSTILVERYRRWFEYEQQAHRLTIASLREVAPEQQASPEWQKAASLFAHMMVARQIWLHRLGAFADEPHDFFPTGFSLERLEAMAEEMRIAWTAYLEAADDAELARVYDYRRSDGKAFRNSVEDTLTTMFGHSFYHRGQIASLVRAMGGEPAATDFIFWAREAIEGP